MAEVLERAISARSRPDPAALELRVADAWSASAAAHVDTSRFGAADAVAGAGADQLALELSGCACRTAAEDRYFA
jgi:hypothetical protein